MKPPRNPWQKLLEDHIQNKEPQPRPAGFFTRAEIIEMGGKRPSSTDRFLRELVKKNKLEVRKVMVAYIDRSGKKLLRWVKGYKILP